ncbi:MAG: hypothetical protein BWY95_02795 [Bacteroidetes bacterium ADurb.BinA104]|nr:MAG: hypothetical protein BWY95_02795 [Bacteroidetes bacterium ADurb.BinA104]
MLDRDHHGFHTFWFAVFIFDRNLTLAVRQDALDELSFAAFINALGNTMREHQRQRQILTRFLCCISVYSTLITSSDRTIRVAHAVSCFNCRIHSGCDISALPMNEHEHCKLPRIISDFAQHISHDKTYIHFFSTGDFARHDNFALSRHNLASYTRSSVLSETSIQDIVGNQIAELIRMTFANTFRCFISCHITFLHFYRVPNRALSSFSIASS